MTQQTHPDHDAYASADGCGLTKRELFAAMAMQGLLSARLPPTTERSLAENAITCADSLIKALNQSAT